jgi:predicted Zn-dependent peptidase
MNSDVKKTYLDNDIRILTKKMAGVRSICMGVWVNVGSRDETVAENGLSHFIEHMIFKGTKKRTGFQIAKEFDAIGGHTNAFTSMENTCYHAKVMDTHLDTMVDILSDIFLNSVFDAEDVEKERPVIFQEIGMVEDSPDEFIHHLSGNAYWGDNPLGRSILGTRENVLGFESATIKDFFHRFYQPAQIVISAAGNLEHNYFVDLIRKAFDSIPRSSNSPERVTPTGCSTIHLQNRELEQVHVCLIARGLSLSDPRRFAISLMNTILGGNMSSRLFQEIRENRGLAYSVYSFISPYVDTGMFGIYAGIDPKRGLETIDLILEQMRNLKEKKVSSTELEDAKEYTKGNLMLASESNENQMVRLAQNEILFGRYIPLQDVVDKIESVTADDIGDLAEYLFQTDPMSLIMLGPVEDRTKYEGILTL